MEMEMEKIRKPSAWTDSAGCSSKLGINKVVLARGVLDIKERIYFSYLLTCS